MVSLLVENQEEEEEECFQILSDQNCELTDPRKRTRTTSPHLKPLTVNLQLK